MQKTLLAAALAAVTLSVVPGFSQTLGELTGRVSDPSGAGVAGATLTLTNVNTNAVRTTATTAPAITRSLRCRRASTTQNRASGLQDRDSNNIEVQVQQTVRLDFTLQVGQVTESVEVSAQADLLQAENASVGTVIENKGVTELPLNGREYLNLVALSANVNTLSSASGQAGSREGGDRAASPSPRPDSASCSTTSRSMA